MAPEAFFRADPVIQIHIMAATGALLTGISIFFLPRGRRLHQSLGITTAALLAVTAISAIFITGLNGNHWSLIHAFVPLTLMGLFATGMAVSRRNFKAHRRHARGLILGALLIPAALTLLPGRLMHQIVFG